MAATSFHILEARAVQAGIWGSPSSPPTLLDIDSTVFLAFLEGIVRETDEGTEELDRMYLAQRPKPRATVKDRAARRAEIERFARLTGGAAS